ncbi:MAG TPA: glycosyltransferase, partial [Phycisphaerales bacterium]|nr:glycosyltransferase [Phycisphaerales bacterium]
MTSNIDNRKIKVAHFIWWIPHYRVPIFRRLSQNSYIDFEVCAGDNTDIPGGAKVASANEVGNIEGVNWRHLKSRRFKGPLFKDFEWQPEAVKIVLKEDIDIVISLGYLSLSNILVRIICKLRGIPVIEWSQGVKCHEKGIRWFVRKLYFKFASAFLLYGDFARVFFVSHGFSNHQTFVVYNSLNHQEQVEIREQISQSDIDGLRQKFGVHNPDTRLVVHSGRLEKQKKIPVLLKAIRLLNDEGCIVNLILIGDGRERENLEVLAREIGVEDQVFFYGSCYEEKETGLVFSSTDICVAPGAVGLVAMHSLVYGTAILTCKNDTGLHGPEIETIKEGCTGGYFKEDDARDLANKMKKMLYPVSCKHKMAKACMDVIDNYYNPKYQERVIIQAINYVLPE